MSVLRRVTKRAVEGALVGGGVASLARRWRAGRTLVLAYHNIVPDGEAAAGDPSLHLPQRVFARQLDALIRTHDVVSLEQALDEPEGATRPRVVITFDDAAQGAVTAGVEELVRRGLPGTIFVAPAFVGGRSFWWDALCEPGAGTMSEALRSYALDQLRGADDAIRSWAEANGFELREPPAHQRCATEAQLRAAVQPAITFGSHTWSHPNLVALDDAELDRELTESRRWLAERFENVLNWVAYPYGRHDARVAEAAARAGYDAGMRVDGGWLPTTDGQATRHSLPRHNVPAGLSLNGFRLRTAGIFT